MSDYDVGYGKPPEEHRFKKGQSGNPAGRPRGSKNKKRKDDVLTPIEQMVLDEANRCHPVQEGDRTVEMPLIQIILRSTAAKAAKGDIRAQKHFTELVQGVQEKQDDIQRQTFEGLVQLKVHLQQKLDAHLESGLAEEQFPALPHPDDIIIDLAAGEARVAGPVTEEDANQLNLMKEMLLEDLENIKKIQNRLRRTRSTHRVDELRAELEDASDRLEKTLNMFADLGDRWPRHWPPRELEQWRVGRQVLQGRKVHPPSQLIRLNLEEAMKARAKK